MPETNQVQESRDCVFKEMSMERQSEVSKKSRDNVKIEHEDSTAMDNAEINDSNISENPDHEDESFYSDEEFAGFPGAEAQIQSDVESVGNEENSPDQRRIGRPRKDATRQKQPL
ncbi:hypothetical protein CBL_21379, partial [Carabus blaptoides fortunei]